MRLKIIAIVLLFIISNLIGKSTDNIEMFTEQYPPDNMMIDGKLTGTSAEVLNLVLKQMKSKQSSKDVRVTSWARGYAIVQKKKNSMLFSTTRVKERERLFKWVGPISKTNIGIIAPKRKNIKINKISDLNKYRIGTILKDIGEILLLSNGVSKDAIEYVKGDYAIDVFFKYLNNNKIDVFAYDIDSAFKYGKIKGFDMSKYEVIYVLEEGELYFAFNKNTNDVIINKWQKALDEIKANGSHAKIFKK